MRSTKLWATARTPNLATPAKFFRLRRPSAPGFGVTEWGRSSGFEKTNPPKTRRPGTYPGPIETPVRVNRPFADFSISAYGQRFAESSHPAARTGCGVGRGEGVGTAMRAV